MKKTRALLATLLATLCLAFLFTGCIGPNPATNQLRNWNAELTGNKWGDGLIGFVLVPVQGVTWLADITIFNTWQFWSGDPLIADPGAYPTKMVGGK